MSRAPFRLRFAGLILLPLALAAAAQPAGEASAAPNVIRLEPKAMEGLKTGRAVVVKGKAGPEGHRFLVDQLTSLMPVTIALRPTRRGDALDMQLSKYAWNQPLREGDTDGDILQFRIRTEGEFQIVVKGEEPATPYRLLVWVGDEVKPTMRPVVVKASEFEDGGPRDWGSLVLWVIAGLLLVGIVLLAILVLRRKPR